IEGVVQCCLRPLPDRVDTVAAPDDVTVEGVLHVRLAAGRPGTEHARAVRLVVGKEHRDRRGRVEGALAEAGLGWDGERDNEVRIVGGKADKALSRWTGTDGRFARPAPPCP